MPGPNIPHLRRTKYRLTLELSDETWGILRSIAKQNGCSGADAIAAIVEQWAGNYALQTAEEHDHPTEQAS